ncbi:MAG: hypothetical protein U0325_31095 [Polyangiales bacterium]
MSGHDAMLGELERLRPALEAARRACATTSRAGCGRGAWPRSSCRRG